MSYEHDHCPHCRRQIKEPRSGQQLRRFFALCRAAYEMWPEKDAFQPESAEHLRKWLLIQCGYSRRKTLVLPVDSTGLRSEALLLTIEAAIRAAGEYPFLTLRGDSVEVVSARSISYAKASHKEASRMFSAVDEFLEIRIGVRGEELLQHWQAAA